MGLKGYDVIEIVDDFIYDELDKMQKKEIERDKVFAEGYIDSLQRLLNWMDWLLEPPKEWDKDTLRKVICMAEEMIKEKKEEMVK